MKNKKNNNEIHSVVYKKYENIQPFRNRDCRQGGVYIKMV